MEYSTSELAKLLDCTVKTINEYRRVVENELGYPVGTKRGQVRYFSESEANAIATAKQIGKVNQRSQEKRVDSESVGGSAAGSIDVIKQRLVKTVDDVSTKLASQTQQAIVVGTFMKMSKIDPQVSDVMDAFDDLMFDAVDGGVQDFLGGMTIPLLSGS